MPERPTVFVVDDDTAMRTSLARLLASAGLHAQTFASAEAFLSNYNPATTGCLVLDVQLGGMTGLDLQDELRARGRCPPVIMISGYADIPRAVRATKAGAVDFLEKPLDDVVFLEHVQQAVQQDAASQSERRLQQHYAQRLATLTPRERQTLDLLVAAKNTQQIAHTLGISPKTVDNHRNKVLDKLQVEDVVELVHLIYRYYLLAHIGPSSGSTPGSQA